MIKENFDEDVNLNVNEIGILLSSLQLISMREEYQIAKEFGSVPALYNKLYSIYETMDSSQLGIQYDVAPSF